MAGHLFCILVLIPTALFGLTLSMDSEAALKAVAHGNVDFSQKLYKVLAAASPDNLIVSPLSVEVVLAMAQLGARGKTAQEIAAGISLPEDPAVVQSGFLALLNSLKSTKNYTLEIANKIYAQQNFALKKEFNSATRNSFLSEAQELDFAKNVEAANIINKWVEEQTKSRIKNLISADMLSGLTRLVLVNAVYFKGYWKHKFNPDLTRSEPFYLNDHEKKSVQMMRIKKKFRYSESDELDAQVLEMAYEGDTLSMVLLLPRQRNGLQALEVQLTGSKLQETLEGLRMEEVEVSLPRFKLESTIELNEPLKKLGMPCMFNDCADFSGMADQQLVVSKVVQKAFIEVNEEGSEAAAATGMMVMARMAFVPSPPKQFVADHPFAFILRDRASSALLFAGRLVNPL